MTTRLSRADQLAQARALRDWASAAYDVAEHQRPGHPSNAVFARLVHAAAKAVQHLRSH